MEDKRYATLADLRDAIEKLEAKVPSRWEVRAIGLGILIATKWGSDVPAEVTNAALAVLGVPVLGAALKGIWAVVAARI